MTSWVDIAFWLTYWSQGDGVDVNRCQTGGRVVTGWEVGREDTVPPQSSFNLFDWKKLLIIGWILLGNTPEFLKKNLSKNIWNYGSDSIKMSTWMLIFYYFIYKYYLDARFRCFIWEAFRQYFKHVSTANSTIVPLLLLEWLFNFRYSTCCSQIIIE